VPVASVASNRTPTRRAWLALIGVGLTFAFELYGLFFPGRASFRRYPLAVPDPFTGHPPLRPIVLLTVLVAGGVLLAIATKRSPRLAMRPWRTLVGIFALGIALHLAMIASVQGGVEAFSRRAMFSAHREFLYASVWARDLPGTLRHYEDFVQGRMFLLAKGPGVTVLFYALRVTANAPAVKPLVEPLAPSHDTVASWIAEQHLALDAGQIDELRYLLGLMFVLFPVLTYLPIFFIFWMARHGGHDALGLLAASLYLFVPAVALLVAHLDTALFPLLVTALLAWFVVGVREQKLVYVAAAAVVFTLYFTVTLAAAAVLAFLLPYVVIAAWSRMREGKSGGRVALQALAVTATFAGIFAGGILLLSFAFHLDFVGRYTIARKLQSDWQTEQYDFFWARADALGWFLSFGLAQSWLLLAQVGRSTWRFVAARADAVDEVVLGWLCLSAGLLVFGRQHGETNRLWTFLAPVACLALARLLYDHLLGRRLVVPLGLFLLGLLLTRYRLSYF
jgi:hypothetical protein